MTTASVYYHPKTGGPWYVLIDGDQGDVPDGTAVTTDDERHAAADIAIRSLGWRIADGARIVRQADGRGTVDVVPNGLRPGLPPLDPAALRVGVVYVTQEPSADEPWPTLLTVAVDGLTASTVIAGRVGDLDPWADQAARATVDDTLASMTYVRNGPLVPDGPSGGWTCTASPTDRGRGAQSDDWHDHPTLVRMDDATAEMLRRTADLLGIPADTLASTWIRKAAADAGARRAWMLSDIVDHSRITGWHHDGSPTLRG